MFLGSFDCKRLTQVSSCIASYSMASCENKGEKPYGNPQAVTKHNHKEMRVFSTVLGSELSWHFHHCTGQLSFAPSLFSFFPHLTLWPGRPTWMDQFCFPGSGWVWLVGGTERWFGKQITKKKRQVGVFIPPAPSLSSQHVTGSCVSLPKVTAPGTCLVVHWLRLHALQCRGHRFNPRLENQDPICHMARPKIK